MTDFFSDTKETFLKWVDPTQKTEAINNGNDAETNRPSKISWIYIFLPKPKKMINIGVGEGLVVEEEIKLTFWQRLFKKKKKKSPRQHTTQPKQNGSSEFVSRLQREANIMQKEIIASSIASILSTFIAHPLEVIKANFQAHRQPRTMKIKRMRGKILYFIKHLKVTKGLRYLYRGHMESQRYSILQVFSMFYTYHQFYKYLQSIEQLKDYPNFLSFFAGLVSATIPVMALYPITTLRERHEIKKKYVKKHGHIYNHSTPHDLRTFRPIFYGCFSMYLHMGTQYGLRFLFYNYIRHEMILLHSTHDKATSTNKHVTPVDSIDHLTNFQLIMAGGVAAVLGDLLVHPLETVYTRLQMTTLKRQQYKFDHTCRRFGQCVLSILKYESIFAFYSGVILTMLRSAINVAVQFAVYEKAKNWLRPLLPT